MNEYNDCGAFGSTAVELDDADESGRAPRSFCFCLDRKWCRCFSLSSFLSRLAVAVVVTGTNVEVEVLAEEYTDPAADEFGSVKLVIEALANPARNSPRLGEGRAGASFLSISLSFEIPILFGLWNSFILERSLTFVSAGFGTGVGSRGAETG